MGTKPQGLVLDQSGWDSLALESPGVTHDCGSDGHHLEEESQLLLPLTLTFDS